jgi:hypothetical protein
VLRSPIVSATTPHDGTSTAPHPDLAPLAFLLGTWSGEGAGRYATIEPFAYREEITFQDVGKPFLVYRQRTWALDDGRPLHSEFGYWRPKPGGRLEVVLAESTGHAEVLEGALDEGEDPVRMIRLATTSIGPAGTAKDVRRTTRTVVVARDQLRYELEMQAVGQPLSTHLQATLSFIPSA